MFGGSEKMYDHDIEVDLDYEHIHKQLSKKYKIREHLTTVMTVSGISEISINLTVDAVKRKINPNILVEWADKDFVPTSAKLTALRSANIISEELYQNLRILFKIRNAFAHRVFLSLEECKTAFDDLKDAIMPNPFLEKLPNDIVKFQLVSSCCQVTLGKIIEKIDPDSVIHLEATEATEFKIDEDW